jgi:Fe-S cluster assembly protein SufD
MDAASLDALLGAGAAEREESWRYSRNALRALTQQHYVAADAGAQLPAALLEQVDWPETRGARIVFINGAYSTQHSDAALDVRCTHERHEIVLPENASHPLHIVYASAPGAAPSHWHGVGEIHLPRGAATVVEHHVCAAGGDVFAALSSQLVVGAAAELHLVTITDAVDNLSLYRRQHAHVAAQGRYRSTHVLGCGRLLRLDLGCDLEAANARCEQRGVFALRGREHVDVQLDVRHLARDTASDVLWRGVADQRARGILRGAITVAAGADGADAKLQTKNVLLSAHAEIDAQPVLEIYADEVKAAHGATVGQLDERALFYLRSRGIPAALARNLLIAGFCHEAIAAIDDTALLARLGAALDARLPQSSLPNSGAAA